MRNLVNRAFTPKMVAELEPRIREIARDYVGRVAESGTMDIVAYMGRVFADRRRVPRDDLISALVAVEDGGDTLSESELVGLTVLILGAGHETTTNLIGNAVVGLLRHPTQRRRLQDDPALMPTAVEEFLRWDSPVQLTDRVALEDCEVAGARVKRGTMVATVLGAANRDPVRFADPDALDVGRRDVDHVSFGHGVHFCLGAALARLETQVAIGALLHRFPDWRGEGGATDYRRSMVLRGPTRLMLRLG
jgi:cytochrome P450